jgi:hypothetical protein
MNPNDFYARVNETWRLERQNPGTLSTAKKMRRWCAEITQNLRR